VAAYPGLSGLEKSRPCYLCRVAITLVLVLMPAALVAGCGSGGASSSQRANTESAAIDQLFPTMASGNAPGASAESINAAAALGRGINLGNMLESPTGNGEWGVMPDSVTDFLRFVPLAADAGFTHVRIPVRWSNHASTDAAAIIDPVFAARVDGLVDAALARGLYVIVNVHHYRQLDGDNLDKDEARVDDNVVELRFLNLWRQIARRYANRSPKLLFELYNEPHGKQNESWNTLMSRALREVRQTNPGRIVIVGPTQWNNADALASLRLPPDANLVVTVHNYEPFKFTHQGADWITPVLPAGVTCCDEAQRKAMTRAFDLAAQWGKANRYPVHVGEFGAYERADIGSRVAYTRIMRDLMEARQFSWTYWELASGFGIYDPVANAWRTRLRDALVSP
jgi:endoglucanase